MHYEIMGADGRSLEVDAVDWMMAMCQAIDRLGIEVSGWVCETQPHGVVHVADPMSGMTWVVRPTSSPAVRPRPTAPPPFRPAPPAVAAPARSPSPPSGGPRTGPPYARRDPTTGPPPDIAARMFDLSRELAAATDANDACRRALDLILGLIRCEAGSVLRGGIDDDVLTFVAVAGPAARTLLGRKLRFGEGLVGAAFDLGITIQVSDVSADPRHLSEIDHATGFHTRAVLCVPVRTPTEFYGAIELLNPPPATGRANLAHSEFQGWQVELVEQVATSLAARLAGAR